VKTKDEHTVLASAFRGVDVPSYDFLSNCIHCGLCLPHCPTYALTLRETSSPRGRIRLMKSVAEGELEITRGFIEEMYFCLDCQACETACPAGVKYGALVEASRAQIEEQKLLTWHERFWKALILRWIFLSNRRLKFFARLLRLYQASGLEKLLEATKFLHMTAPKMEKLQPLSPRISRQFSDDVLPEIVAPLSSRRYRVGFLTGCLMNIMYADVNVDTVQVLRQNECEVIIPHGQVCCGSLHAHNGMMRTARLLARQMIELFESYKLDAIVMNSAGCGAFMKEYGHLLSDEEEYADRARRLSTKVKDLTEFLLSIEFVRPRREIRRRVAYHEACHLVHSQKITDQPKQLLALIPGLEVAPLNEATWCCGSAGIYNIVRYEDSMKLLKRKLENIKETHAEAVVMENPGCLAQIDYGVKKEKLSIEVLHLATLLRQAYADQA
jgi:glycolate oxidase iron-sulfur subunit